MHKLVKGIEGMNLRAIQFILLMITVISFTGCTEDNKAEKEKLTTEEEEENINEVVNEFFYSIYANDFEASKKLATKASYSSLNFLSKASGYFESNYFSNIISCEIENDEATCLCEFGYYDQIPAQQNVSLKKFDGEWLVDLRLVENFENIFLYDYGYSLNSRITEDVVQLPFEDEVIIEIKSLLERILSSNIKLGFSSSLDVAKVDSLFSGNSKYGSSNWENDDFSMVTSYEFTNGKLNYCAVEIDDANYSVNMDQYVKSLCEVMKSTLGEPFNVPEEYQDQMEQIFELRWFIKGYNEMLVLTMSSGYFMITLYEIP